MSMTLKETPPDSPRAPTKKSPRNTFWRRCAARWRAFAARVPKPVKILIATVVGTTLILLGILLSVPMVPGPGSALIFAGIAVLATEFIWARQLLAKIKDCWHWFKPKYVDPLIARYRRWRGLDKS